MKSKQRGRRKRPLSFCMEVMRCVRISPETSKHARQYSECAFLSPDTSHGRRKNYSENQAWDRSSLRRCHARQPALAPAPLPVETRCVSKKQERCLRDCGTLTRRLGIPTSRVQPWHRSRAASSRPHLPVIEPCQFCSPQSRCFHPLCDPCDRFARQLLFRRSVHQTIL